MHPCSQLPISEISFPTSSPLVLVSPICSVSAVIVDDNENNDGDDDAKKS